MIDLRQGDCLELMKDIPNKSVDMILCDLPYGTTACKWDSIVPFDPLWEQYKRIIKDNGAIVLFGNEPFASVLRMSNLTMYRYDWCWDKTRGYNFQQANYAPMKCHEYIMVFSKNPAIFSSRGSMAYYPIKTNLEIEHKSGAPTNTEVLHKSTFKPLCKKQRGYYPLSILTFKKDNGGKHPTQKPVALLEYLIRTYTREGEVVLDNCMGSGSTGVACLNTDRNFIGIELDEKYFNIAKERIDKNQKGEI